MFYSWWHAESKNSPLLAIARRAKVVLFSTYVHYSRFDYKFTRIQKEGTGANKIKYFSADNFTVWPQLTMIEIVFTTLITSGKSIPERGYFEKRCNFLHMVHIKPVK